MKKVFLAPIVADPNLGRSLLPLVDIMDACAKSLSISAVISIPENISAKNSDTRSSTGGRK